MIVKGIIKSIDYSGNTCTVRIPIFESAANENEVVISAILSTLPGIYNGYKEEDVVFIAFENNDYDMPVVIGKLYLGVENEKNDPRGAIVCNNITAAQPISIPISSKLTLDNDPQHSPVIGVDKGIDSYKSIADLAKNLQKQDEKIGSLSVKVIDDGENLGAEIAKKVSITDEATKQRGLGWNLNTEKWEIYAKDTVGDTNSLAKLPIMTIDRTGMVISGNLVLTGYPQTTEIKYTNSTDKNTPPTGDDVKWQDNTSGLYQDTYYIWKRTREVFYAYNAETDQWELTKYGDAHYECITGAKGDSGYNTVTVMLYKRSKTSISGKQIDIDLYYKFSDQKLYINDTCTTDYTLPEGWYYTISGTGDSSNGDLYCIAAVAHSNTESDKIPHSEWAGPTLYVENGADGKPGDSIYTISIDNDFDSVPADINGNVSSSYPWKDETTHNVRVYYGKEAQDFTVVDQSGTTPSTGLCLKYKLTNVTLENITPDPGVSSKVATAWINDLSADTGNILYTLYVDGVETGITGKFSATKIKSPAPTYTISIDNDFATIPTSTVNAKIYRETSLKFKPADSGYSRATITVADTIKKLPGMKLSTVTTTTKLKKALLQTPAELITGTNKSYVEDITKHNITVYCNDDVETITADNFIVKLDSDGLDADMDETQNYLVCELGGFDSTGARATDFPGMNPTISDNVVTNYITALSALGDISESKNVYIQYTYYVKGAPVATAKFEVTRHTGPTTYYLSSNVSTIKVNKDNTITPDNVTCTAYSLDTGTNTNTKFTNGTWKYKWDVEPSWNEKSTSLDLSIDTANVITKGYKQLYIELYLDNQLWDRETVDVIADGENAVDYRIIASSGTIKVTKTGNKNPQFITVDFKQINGSATPAAFSGNYKVFIDNGTDPVHQGTTDSIVLATSGAVSPQIDVSSAKSSVIVELYTADGSTKLESETIDVVADGADGQPGVYIKEVKQWYILKASSFPEPGSEQTPETIKPADNDEPTYDPAPTSTTVDEWMSTPPEAVNGYNIWTCYGSIFSDDISSDSKKRHIEYSIPVKDAAYALAQGKTTNYYSPTEPIYNVKKGDCWFDTSTAGKETLKQWDGSAWQDIGGEVVQNKVTANYINALDITAKKITVLDKSDNNKPLFEADGINGTGNVSIANFTVKNDKLYSGTHDNINSPDAGIYLGVDGLSIGSNFKVTAGATPTVAIAGYTKSVEKKYCIVGFAVVTATTNKPVWWDDWNDAHWSDTPPNREDGNYIWEWTKTTSTTNANTDTTKDTKVCITGAKGDPGKDGTDGLIPSIGQNGNWWIGENDTGIKAEGLDGHTPEVTIGENGNWYIDGKDTGVLAKGTPGEPGKTGRSVLSVTKYYKLNSSKPEKPTSKNPSDWYISPPTFESGKNYYESDLTLYDSAVDGKDYSWSDVVENSMLTVDFINSLGITAKKITVLQDNSKDSNDSNPILFQADGTSNNSGVKIGGFTVDSNRLYAGTPGTNNSIELASFYNLIAYKSNNQGVKSSEAVSKITVNKATNLTVYIRSDAESSWDYTMISNPNVSSYPTSSSSIDVKAHTSSNQNSSSALTGYTKVEYYGLKQNDYIYIVYKKDGSNDVGADTGYLLIPETTDISITAVGDTYYFERATSLDINRTSIKVGRNFSIDTEGKIYTKAGEIGALKLTPTTLSVGKRFYDNNSFLYLNTENNYAPTGWNDRAESAISTLEASSARFNVQILGIDSDSYNGDTVVYMDGRHYSDGGLVSVYQTQSGDQDNYQVRSRIPITKFEKIPISIGGDHSPYIIPGPEKWDNKRYAPVRIILSGERIDPATDTWYDMSEICSLYGIIIIDGVATSTIAKASNTSLSGYKQIAAAYYENHDLSKFERGELTNISQIPYSSLWVGNDGDGGAVSKISFIITGWAVSELV